MNWAYCFVLKGQQDPNFMQDMANNSGPAEAILFIAGAAVMATFIWFIRQPQKEIA